MFHLPEHMDCTIYPGELVTVFGPTGSNKTTFAQNVALGVDFVEDKIVTEWQIPTLFLSLELSAWYMHRRHLQIVSGLPKERVNSNLKEVYEAYKDKLSHMVIQTIAPSLEQIQDKIKTLQPALVVVDYIDLVDTDRRGEYEQIKYISHSLSNMAVNNDVIIMQISQVAREYSRNEVLDLYAGKGSGAIENASRKVIGLNGQAKSTFKKVQLFKNTDGELFDAQLEWRPSFRLRKVKVD
jgi:replicative DNA helicase